MSRPYTRSAIEHKEMLAELNELDSCCRYVAQRAQAGVLTVRYQAHEWEITREEAKERLTLLRQIKGVDIDDISSSG